MRASRLLALGLAALGSAASILAPRAPSVLPSQDPFYAPPANLDSFQPGHILKTRKTPNKLANLLLKDIPVNLKDAYHIMYRTSDSHGKPVAAVSTLMIPHNADPSRLLSYQTAYDTADNDCSPSFYLQQNNSESGSIEQPLMAAALNQGWNVVTADYEGLGAAFTAGVLSGQATLDAVRAALASGSFSQIQPTAKFAMLGYSGGGLASEWAAELQPTYAPELQSAFVGVAAGGLTPNIINVVKTINKTPFVTLAPRGIVGLAQQYPELSDYLDQHIRPEKKEAFFSVRDCFNTTDISGQDIGSFFDNGLGFLTDPVPTRVVNEGGIMGLHGKPAVPVYIYKAVGDEVSKVADTDALVKKYCDAGGVDIRYIRNHFGEHGTEAILGAPGAIAWLQERFAGLPVRKGCATQQVFISRLGPDAVLALGEVVVATLESNLGLPLGPLLPILKPGL